MRGTILSLSALILAAGLITPVIAQAPAAPAAPYVFNAKAYPDVKAAEAAAIKAATSDSTRPAADSGRDAKRKPGEMIAIAGLKPGMTVVELSPGGGYFTRIFSKYVGAKGKVITIAGPGRDGAPPTVAKIAAEPGYSNISVVAPTPALTYVVPEKADLVWTSRNYHDFRNPSRNLDAAAINKAAFDALKPGGIYVVLDHAAASTAGPDVPGTLHRINAEQVKTEVTAAGFQLVRSYNELINPSDDLNKRVQEEAAPDISSQFILKFRKPS